MAQDVWQAGFEERLTHLIASDSQVRDRVPDSRVASSVRPNMGLAQLVDAVMTGYADREAVKERRVVITPGGTRQLTHDHTTLTYRQLWSRARAVATSWQRVERGPSAADMVCSIGTGSNNYAALELACIASGVVSVPLIANSSQAQWQTILNETRPAALAVDIDYLDPAIAAVLASEAHPKAVYVLDYREGDLAAKHALNRALTRLSAEGIVLETFDSLVDAGTQVPQAPLPVSPAGTPPGLAQIIYTSGATGTPKGAMFTTAHLAAMWFGQSQSTMPTIVTHYMPMSHVAGRMVLTGALARGGTCFFSTGNDPAQMWDDIALARPTEFFLIPRVCEMIFDRYRRVLASLPAGDTELERESNAKTQLREQLLGGRIVSAVNGSAPLDVNLHAFMESMLNVPVHDAYGSTEAGGVVMFDNRIQRPPVIEYKLADVPELGYHTTDRPHPRGELLLKTMSMIPGYLNRPDLNDDILDADGFYRTGDVMAETAPDELQFVERRNNVLKLSQAEFVAVATLESVYSTSPDIHQIFVYGRSGRASILAVIVPTDSAARGRDDNELRDHLAGTLHQIAKREGLHPYEIPRDFIIERDPFSVANGLLSGVSKPLRPKLTQHYADELEQLHQRLSENQEAEIADLQRSVAERPTLETVLRAAKALLGGNTAVSPSANFTDIGGDSMTAYTFATQLSDLFDLEVPVTVILSPANDLRHVADYIEQDRAGKTRRVTAADVHQDPTRLLAAELTLDKFLPPSQLEASTNIPVAVGAPVYLVTGANGYLGRFLTVDLLESASQTGGRVVALARGATSTHAKQRLESSLTSADSELAEKYHTLSERLEVINGDISQPRLGVTDETWARLSADVTHIVHPGALVNHVLPYQQLFGPNVAGTAELIRLATTATTKHITYLSSVGIADQITPGTFDETADVRSMSPARIVSDQYANGYANTKWASEVLLREANDQYGVPVSVFRSNMILAHTRYAGHLNQPDMLTRLLYSILITGLAPSSFYLPNADGSPKRTHFDGLPVDFTTVAITALTGGRGHTTFNLVNPHDDGISLDTFVDWLIEAGHPIQRIDNYSDWYRRLEISLRQKPAEVGQQSLLPLLHAFKEPETLPDIVTPAPRFLEAVTKASVAQGTIPSVRPELIKKYAADLHHLGLL
ncbi:carboxylic acid reductase [Naumannella halotolerans]|uniref:Fatty acid CoA ligase FadD9 n=1 Tax=Naumannella halotolerans TaxID=993414 RepID=A0A4R7IZC0_9ACTN|nr:carboxylic acid reductase [Naumannella halotolerans]TDT30080.1 fatty acid CoA ligase FadD9 [Naumannella halotolerans]